MKKNKKYWILGVALLFLFIFVIIAGTTRLATDSGWDTDYDIGYDSDLVINGLGFVKIVNKGKIDIYLDKNVNTFVRKSLI